VPYQAVSLKVVLAGIPFRLNQQTIVKVKIMDNKLVLIILAVLLPPIAVFLKCGVGKDLIINIVLCLVFWIPGIIHAAWLVTR
jgi:uncharacterized membrane protein YqaE (UPF0057 family)